MISISGSPSWWSKAKYFGRYLDDPQQHSAHYSYPYHYPSMKKLGLIVDRYLDESRQSGQIMITLSNKG